MRVHRHTAESGGATLVLTLTMAFIVLLVAAFAHRNIVSGVQTSTSQYRSTQAFEAAEAGLEWTLAKLNSGTRLDAACRVSEAPGAQPFSELALHPPDNDGARRPRTAGTLPLQAACAEQAGIWACTCPREAGAFEPSEAAGVHFATRLLPGGRAGLLRVVSAGCSGGAMPCKPSIGGAAASAPGNPGADASAQLQVTLARLPALSSDPAAALSVQGALDLGAHPWVVQNVAGTTVHTGSDILANGLVLQGAPGGRPSGSTWANDAALAGVPAEAQFASLFRLNKTAWPQQPTVRRVECSTACDSRLAEALGRGITHPLIWLDGGLHLDRPATLGTPERPVLLIANGPIRLGAAVVIHGLVYGTAPEWSATAGAVIHGAVVQEGPLRGSGVLHIRHDAAVLKRLRTQYGTWARVSGSWRDF